MKVETGIEKEVVQDLREDFVKEYEEFEKKYDLLARDLYKGAELDELAIKFLNKHEAYLKELPYCEGPTRGELPSSLNQKLFCQTAIKQDIELINLPIRTESSDKRHQYQRVLSGLYARACQARHLLVTYNLAFQDKENDRTEAIYLGRKAIRYDADNFFAVYWYMIAIGWQLDVISGPRERIQLAGVFSRTCARCIQLDPEDPLAHNLLGRYHYEIASLSWLERTVANKILGGKLTSTMEDSEREFRLAHSLKGDWLPTGLWMARVLLAQKKSMEEVREWINFGLNLKCTEPSSNLEKIELLDLKAKLKLSS